MNPLPTLMKTIVVFVLLLATWTAGRAAPAGKAAGVAEARDGNIYFRDSGGTARQLTSSGHDSSPALAPDGRWIVFVRAVPGKSISTGGGEVPAAELWQVRTDGAEATRLVAPRNAEDVSRVIAGFANVGFSSDGRLVYFVTPAYATSGAVHVVDTTTLKERFVMAGDDLEVVPAGEYRDCLLVRQHRYFIGGGSFDWFWLFKPDGTEVGPVGEDPENFRMLYMTEGASPDKGNRSGP